MGLRSRALNSLPLEQPNSFCNDVQNIGVLFWMAVANPELRMRFPAPQFDQLILN